MMCFNSIMLQIMDHLGMRADLCYDLLSAVADECAIKPNHERQRMPSLSKVTAELVILLRPPLQAPLPLGKG